VPGRGQPARELVIITGLSGSGKGTVLRCLEDLGYFAVDNLPIGLIPKFAELALGSEAIARAALVVDIREGQALKRFPGLYEKLRHKMSCRLLFLEADDDVLIRRFSETRRPHPLGAATSVSESIALERKQLKAIQALADQTVNTTEFTVHDLRRLMADSFRRQTSSSLAVRVLSFGFRHGVPPDADLVFDVRFLPNPNYVPEFKPLTGRNPKVARYIRGFPQTAEFMDKATDMLAFLLPHYKREGKTYLTIAFGCTGGHHRSVMIAAEIARRLQRAGYAVKSADRDVRKRV